MKAYTVCAYTYSDKWVFVFSINKGYYNRKPGRLYEQFPLKGLNKRSIRYRSL